MKRAELGQIVRYEGELMEVLAIGEGRSVVLRPVVGRDDLCPTCGQPAAPDVHLMESAPLFQKMVQPVPTISDG